MWENRDFSGMFQNIRIFIFVIQSCLVVIECLENECDRD